MTVAYANDPDLLNSKNYDVVMYLIVRESLLDKMSAGKIAAQCGHAVQFVVTYYFESSPILGFYEQNNKRTELMNKWFDCNYPKIVLKADDNEWQKLKDYPDLFCFIVKDAGHTQVDPGTETVMALWPVERNNRPKLLSRLQILK